MPVAERHLPTAHAGSLATAGGGAKHCSIELALAPAGEHNVVARILLLFEAGLQG